MKMAPSKIVKNSTQGYGYKYASLADLARAEVKIPKMRVHPSEFGEFIEYLDEDGRWQTGARVVLFESKSMNAAQIYGAALTYARRYTVQMAQAIACDDDEGVEKSKPAVAKPAYNKKDAGGKLNSVLEPSSKQKAWLKAWFIEKEGCAEGEAAMRVATFKTMKQASEEITKLMESEKGGE